MTEGDGNEFINQNFKTLIMNRKLKLLIIGFIIHGGFFGIFMFIIGSILFNIVFFKNTTLIGYVISATITVIGIIFTSYAIYMSKKYYKECIKKQDSQKNVKVRRGLKTSLLSLLIYAMIGIVLGTGLMFSKYGFGNIGNIFVIGGYIIFIILVMFVISKYEVYKNMIIELVKKELKKRKKRER